MELEKLELNSISISKLEMKRVVGGTTTTGYVVVGYAENEYPMKDDGTLDWDAEPIIVDFPDKE